jgi:hypothetical protein
MMLYLASGQGYGANQTRTKPLEALTQNNSKSFKQFLSDISCSNKKV